MLVLVLYDQSSARNMDYVKFHKLLHSSAVTNIGIRLTTDQTYTYMYNCGYSKQVNGERTVLNTEIKQNFNTVSMVT